MRSTESKVRQPESRLIGILTPTPAADFFHATIQLRWQIKKKLNFSATKIDSPPPLSLSAAFCCPLVALVSPFAPVHCVYFEDKPAVCSLSIARGAAGLLPWFAAMRPVIEPETTAPPPRFSSQGEKMTQKPAGHVSVSLLRNLIFCQRRGNKESISCQRRKLFYRLLHNWRNATFWSENNETPAVCFVIHNVKKKKEEVIWGFWTKEVL